MENSYANGKQTPRCKINPTRKYTNEIAAKTDIVKNITATPLEEKK